VGALARELPKVKSDGCLPCAKELVPALSPVATEAASEELSEEEVFDPTRSINNKQLDATLYTRLYCKNGTGWPLG